MTAMTVLSFDERLSKVQERALTALESALHMNYTPTNDPQKWVVNELPDLGTTTYDINSNIISDLSRALRNITETRSLIERDVKWAHNHGGQPPEDRT